MSVTKTRKAKAVKVSVSEQIINNAPRLIESFEVGDVSHQGDLTIVRIASLPSTAKPRKERQLAEGNTQGSRHVLERGKVYSADPNEIGRLIRAATKCEVDLQYLGPVFVSPKDPTENDLTHPEHGHQGFPAGAVCAVVFQRNLDSEEREQRTRD
jgi:hypothetical protein